MYHVYLKNTCIIQWLELSVSLLYVCSYAHGNQRSTFCVSSVVFPLVFEMDSLANLLLPWLTSTAPGILCLNFFSVGNYRCEPLF